MFQDKQPPKNLEKQMISMSQPKSANLEQKKTGTMLGTFKSLMSMIYWRLRVD